MPTLRKEHALAIGLLAGAGLLFYVAHNMAGGSRPPKYGGQYGTTEGSWNIADPIEPNQPNVEWGYRVTPHRFPHRVGHEISTMIEGGHSAASVPRYLPERYWIEKPPSELVL